MILSIVKKAKDSANKRSVDAYGKAVELAVATYLLDTGDYPTSLDNLEVEYSGNEVVCNVKTLNEDGSIYLSECNVKGTDVKDKSAEDGWYHYGKSSAIVYQSYGVGDIITYNGMNFYVIEVSDEASDRVTMLKATPLTVDEVNTYGGVGTDNNHVNAYVSSSFENYQTAYNRNGYGGMQYYSSSTCEFTGSDWIVDGCTTDYAQSEVKYVVDAWALDKFSNGDLVEDATGYGARLLTFEDLTNNLGYTREDGATSMNLNTGKTPSWVYTISGSVRIWTMSSYDGSSSSVWFIHESGDVRDDCVYIAGNYKNYVVRPVITLKKSAI